MHAPAPYLHRFLCACTANEEGEALLSKKKKKEEGEAFTDTWPLLETGPRGIESGHDHVVPP